MDIELLSLARTVSEVGYELGLTSVSPEDAMHMSKNDLLSHCRYILDTVRKSYHLR